MEPQRQYEKALSLKGAKEPCCACGQANWIGGDIEAVVLGTEDTAMKVLPPLCGNCGFVRLHSTDILLSDN
jgi:hypothetical protein